MSDKRQSTARSLRALGNLTVLLALLFAADLAVAWWYGTGTYACAGVGALASESAQLAIGMGGLLLGMTGVMFGGARHPLTLFGVLVMVVGLVASGMTMALFEGVCSAP